MATSDRFRKALEEQRGRGHAAQWFPATPAIRACRRGASQHS